MSIETFIAGVANDLRNALVKSAPVDTGRLKNSIKVLVEGNKLIVKMPDYALYLEYGTGIYGPLGRPITPKEAKALKFEIGGKTVFAKSVKGMTPQPFIRPTIHSQLRRIVKDNVKRHLQ